MERKEIVKTVKNSYEIRAAFLSIIRTKDWITIATPDGKEGLVIMFYRQPWINAGLTAHKFVLLDDAVNYATEFLFN